MTQGTGRGQDDTVSADALQTPASSPSATSPTASQRAPVEGGALLAGRYRLLELLGSGGMGTVYRAHDGELDEVVALKTLRRELIDAPGALERFRREIKLARRITHRGVARAFDIGEHAGERFLTMEYVDGCPLSARIAEGRVRPAEAASIARQIAEALGAAHAAGVVHRDLKPDNVLLAVDGRVVLTDFGVARALGGSDARATVAGGIVGTPAYMAPEQVEGGEVDERSDLYALGLVLFELLTGKLPFEGDTPVALAAARLVTAPRLAALGVELPAALVAIVERCLARAPGARFPGAAAVAAALEEVAPALAHLAPAGPASGQRPPTPLPGPTPPAATEQRLAVMPLRWLGPAEQAWIADGLADDLVDALSLTRGLRVRARAGAPREGESPSAFGQREEVDVVVDGTVRPAGDRIRASLRLVSVADGFQLWAHRAEAAVGDLLAVSDQAAQAIAAALHGASLTAPARQAASAEAVELYLRARAHFGGVATGSEAIALLERALALAPDDPTILSAYAIAASMWSTLPEGKAEWAIQGFQAAQRALELAPHLPDPHVAMARARYAADQVPEAIRSLKAARRASPNSADAEQLLGRIVADTDHLDAAAQHLERALWLDPSRHFARVDLVRVEYLRGRTARALELTEQLRRESPDHYAAVRTRLSLWLDRPLPLDGRTLHPVLAAFNDLVDASMRDRRGLDPAAVARLTDLVRSLGPRAQLRRLVGQSRAEVAGYLGEVEEALAGFAAAVEAGLADVTWTRRVPSLASVRGDPRFHALAAVVEERAAPIIAAYREPG